MYVPPHTAAFCSRKRRRLVKIRMKCKKKKIKMSSTCCPPPHQPLAHPNVLVEFALNNGTRPNWWQGNHLANSSPLSKNFCCQQVITDEGEEKNQLIVTMIMKSISKQDDHFFRVYDCQMPNKSLACYTSVCVCVCTFWHRLINNDGKEKEGEEEDGEGKENEIKVTFE